jgi:hypothetical protein
VLATLRAGCFLPRLMPDEATEPPRLAALTPGQSFAEGITITPAMPAAAAMVKDLPASVKERGTLNGIVRLLNDW